MVVAVKMYANKGSLKLTGPLSSPLCLPGRLGWAARVKREERGGARVAAATSPRELVF